MSNLLEKASILLTPTAYDDGKILSVKPIQTFGSELVVNGDFADNSTWTTQSSVTFTNGTVIMDSANLNAFINQNILTVGRKYRVSITVEALSIVDKLDLINASGITYETLGVGVNVFEITANQTAFRIRTKDGATSTISRASVQEITDGDFDFTRNSDATRVNSAGLIESLQTLSSNLVSNGDFSQEGPELVTNGDFSDGTNGWSGQYGATISVVNSQLQVYNNQNGQSRSSQGITTVIGKSYNLKGTITNVDNSNGIQIKISNNSNLNGAYFNSAFNTTTNSVKVEHTFIATSTTTYIGTNQIGVIGNTGSIDNVSVKEVGQDWDFVGEAELTAQGARVYSSTGSYSSVRQSSDVLTIGNKYKITFNVISTNGTSLANGNSNITYDTSTTGNKTFYITASEVGLIFKRAAAITTDVTITNISVIEITDDTNLPRIDYSPYSGAGTCGHWLFEPQSTNLWRNSEGSDITLTSPLGTFGFYNITSSQITNSEAFTAGTILSATFIVKKADGTTPTVTASGSNGDIIFRITGTSGAGVAGALTDIGNGFYTYKLENYSVNGSNSDNRISNNSGDVVYVSLVQLEQKSFPTSYIPTNGSAVTRNQEAAFGSGNSSLINSTEGTLYAEIAALTQRPDFRTDIALSDGTSVGNVVRIHYLSTVDNTIRVQVRSGGAITVSQSTTVTDIRDFHKIAISYKVNEVKFYIDGVLINTDPNAAMPIGLNQLSFSAGNDTSSEFFGKTKCVAVFKEALTDDELECLTSDETSFSSFNALALANNYTII